MPKIYCGICSNDIDSTDGLFVVVRWCLAVRTYCATCYAEQRPRTGSVHLDSMHTTVGLAISLLMLAILLVAARQQLPVVGAIAVLPGWMAGLRAYSYVKYERPLL